MRAIDADELKKCFSLTLHGKKVYNAEEILMTIQTAPTIEAEPVKHGHWEFIGGYGYQYRCSNCIRCAEHRTNYCPSCGAKMDEAGE